MAKDNEPRGGLDRRAVIQLGGGLAMMAGTGGAALAQAKTRPLKVASIYTVPVEQQWVSRIHKALNIAKDRGDITYKWSENVANTDYERVMRQYSTERAARRVAADFPKIAYLMGSSFQPSKPNFSVFDNFIHEPAYLTGIVAGKATKTNIIGLVGGFAIPEVNRLMHAFMEGALSVNKDTKFLVTFINSWYDPPKAKEAAFAMIDKKADIMYAERFGVTDAAKERGVKAIGNVIDTAAQYPGVVLASALWHMEPTIDRVIRNVLAGIFEPADYGVYSYMAHGGASLSDLDPKLVPADVIAMVKAKEKEILEGAFRVNVNDAEPKSTA